MEMDEELRRLRGDARGIFEAALGAADPRLAVKRVLAREGDRLVLNGERVFDLSKGRVVVVGAGKAGAPMAAEVEEVVGVAGVGEEEDGVAGGAVNVKYGHVARTQKVELMEAGHPLPDENGVRGARVIAGWLEGLNENDLALCVISGGASALLEWPVEGVTLDELRALTNELLRCGATIYEMNTLRKHLSRVKGGQLARLAAPAQVVTLVLSDVLGSPLDVIGSGPTAPDSSTFADCARIVEKYALAGRIPESVCSHLERGARGEVEETPKADDPLFRRVRNVVIADNRIACAAAEEEAGRRGYAVEVVGTELQGEAREVGAKLARRAVEEEEGKHGWIAAGEPTVTLRGHGKGGRAQELALSAAFELAGDRAVVLLSAGTDGTDGPTDAAGAVVDNTTLARAGARGLDARRALEENDAYPFFAELEDLVVTGPTNTNVNDLMIALR